MKPRRSQMKEWIDLGPSHYSTEEYEDCLFQLDRIGKYLGGDRATFKALKNLDPDSILDVGCGGGLFSLRLASLYPNAKVTGIDLSKEAIAYANQQLKKSSLPNVQFFVPKTKNLKDIPGQFDVVLSTLVCHHMEDEEIVAFLKESLFKTKKYLIINDLHRHFLARIGFTLIAPLFFKNRLISHDGGLSIQRSFKKKDFHYYLEKAGIAKENYALTWHWPFRWILKINPSSGNHE